MAQKRASEVDAFLARPETAFPVVLVYGPDAGLVSERADRLAEKSGADLSDPFAAIRLAAEDVEKEPARLYDEAGTVPLFGGRRLIRIRGTGGRQMAEAVGFLGRAPLQDAMLIVEAGDLKKNAPLRTAVEKAPAAMALPCYQDEGRALDRIIDEELGAHGLRMDAETRDVLRSRLGADRLASRGEVRKLCLYALGAETVGPEDVRAIVGDVSDDTVEEAVDAAVSGEVKRLPHLIDRLVSSGTQPFILLQALLRYFQALQVMREAVERDGDPVGRVVERRRPHFRRKAAMAAALDLWDLDCVETKLMRIEAAILQSRKEPALAVALLRQILLDTGVEAARHRLRRRA